MEAFMQIMDELMKMKDIKKDEMLRIIKESLIDAYKRKFKLKSNISRQDEEEEEYELPLGVEIDKGKLYVFLSKEVRKEVEDEHKEIDIDEAKKMLNTDDIEEGDIIDIFIEPKDLGRNGARIVKENIMKRIKGVEEGRVYHEYKDNEGDIFTAIVMRKQRLRGREREKYREKMKNSDNKTLANIIVDLGKGEAKIRPNHQSPKDNYYRGSRIKVYIYKVKRDGIATDIFASRTHQNLVKELIKLEVPEVANNKVTIEKIARKSGYKTKVAVYTDHADLDPVGTCVGMRGIRIQNVVRELNGERVDVIEYVDDTEEMIKRSLKNIDVIKVLFDTENENEAKVVVPESQYTMAIGRGGQNVALAARLTGFKLYIISDIEYREELKKIEKEKLEKVKNLKTVDEDIFEKFKDNNIKSLDDIISTHPEYMVDLLECEIEEAEKVIENAKSKLQEEENAKEEKENSPAEDSNEEIEDENEKEEKENSPAEDSNEEIEDENEKEE